LSRLAPQDPDGEPEEVLLRGIYGDSKDAMFEKGNLPKGWVETDLQNCTDILDNKRIPINLSERNKRQGKIPYYGATGQAGWIDGYIFDEELVLLGEDGVPFLDHSKNKAYLILGKSWVNNHAHVLRAISTVLSNKFLHYFLNQFNYHGFVTGTTRLKLNQSQMKTIPVLIPPINEQHRIVSKIESILARIDACRQKLLALQERTQSGQVSLAALRDSVLKQAFEGRLVPQDPDDEPAEVLLRRMHGDSKDAIFEKRNLPKGWALTKLMTITDYVQKINPKETPDKWYYYCDIDSIDNSKQQILNPKYIVGSDAPSRARQLLKTNDILFSTVRTYLKNIAIVSSDLEGHAVEKQVNNSLVRLGQLKQSVLRKAFEGKLVQQDPNDEPASILLEKIKRQGSDTRVKDKFVNLSHKLGQNRF